MKYKLVYIEWEDASDENGWWTRERAIAWANSGDERVRDVGWLIHETKNYILLAPRLLCQEGRELVGHPMRIPKPWIRKRKVLKIDDKKERKI